MNCVDSSNFAEGWVNLLAKIIVNGRGSSPRDQATKELIPAQLYITDMRNNILNHPARGLSFRFMVAEWLWITAGYHDVATIARYNKNIAQFSDDGVTFNGAYGPRIQPQMAYLLNTLQKPDSRQAVASIWTPNPGPSKDIPCTLTWQMFVRDGKLHAIVNMRSSDIWLGLPYDFFNFSMMSMEVAGSLNLEPGSMTFNLGSSHLYRRDLDKAMEVQDRSSEMDFVRTNPLPGLCPADLIFKTVDLMDDHTIARDHHWVWEEYRRVLRADTNKEALKILGDLELGDVHHDPTGVR